MNRGQAKLANRMVFQIKESETIHEFDLIDMLDMSIWQYKAIKSWFKHRFEHTVQFDPKMKTWRYLPVTSENKVESVKSENQTLY